MDLLGPTERRKMARPDLKGLYAKIGQLALENNCLEGEVKAGLGRYLIFYNQRWPHQSLNGQMPDAIYFQPLPALQQAACMMVIWLLTVPRARVRGLRHRRGLMDNPLPARQHLSLVKICPNNYGHL